jgi:hypothetical protein
MRLGNTAAFGYARVGRRQQQPAAIFALIEQTLPYENDSDRGVATFGTSDSFTLSAAGKRLATWLTMLCVIRNLKYGK